MCAIYKASYRNLSRQNYRYAFKLNISSFDRNFLPANKSTTHCAMSCRFPGLCDKPLLTKVSESKNHCLKRKKAACSEPTSARGGSRNSIERRIPSEGLPRRYFDPLECPRIYLHFSDDSKQFPEHSLRFSPLLE